MPFAALLCVALSAAGDSEPPAALALEDLDRRYRIDGIEAFEPFPAAQPHGATTGVGGPLGSRAAPRRAPEEN